MIFGIGKRGLFVQIEIINVVAFFKIYFFLNVVCVVNCRKLKKK